MLDAIRFLREPVDVACHQPKYFIYRPKLYPFMCVLEIGKLKKSKEVKPLL